LIPELCSLFEDQDLTKLRFTRPSKFVFLCGGIIAEKNAPHTLRDYLYRTKKFSSELNGEVVLAETARNLFHSTKYRDLISFEEDIARIASLVLVIPESPGSLAELGAFATNDVIRRALRVIMQERHENDVSFIRLGPIEYLRWREGRNSVGIFPWQVDNSNRIRRRTISPHYKSVVDFINTHLDTTPASTYFGRAEDLKIFYLIYWVINILVAVSLSVLTRCVSSLLPGVNKFEITNKLYCMVIAGWVLKLPYSHTDYYCATVDNDPFNYSFKTGTTERDSIRRKLDIAKAMKVIEEVPSYVLNKATHARRSTTK
jgi:hypothetical protein